MSLIFIYIMLIFTLLPSLILSNAHQNQPNNVHKAPKSMHFSLYSHDIANKTDFNIVKGKGGPNWSPNTAPFGSIFVLQDPLTTSPNPSSDRLGTIEMFFATHTHDGLYCIGVSKVNLKLKDGHQGSISLAGVAAYNETSDCPVSGGTGDFLFAQGYVRFYPLSFERITAVFRCEFHLFWPPYYATLN